MKLRLNPIGYKYTTEIEHLLDANNKAMKKDFRPKIENQIKELQTFESRRDSVFEELRRKKEELADKRRELARTQAESAQAKASETEITKGVNDKLDETLGRYAKLEQELHQITKLQNE